MRLAWVKRAAMMYFATVLSILLALSTGAFAQGRVPMQNRWPGEATPQAQQPGADEPGQDEPAPAAAPKAAAPKPAAPPKPAGPARIVNCTGVFAKDTTHLKLAQTFSSENVAWAPVDGPDNTKMDATVIYPKDPKRRLEVTWNTPAARMDIQVVVINGSSTWVAPKGIKLGMPIAAIEKLNGKPFRLSPLGKDGGSVLGWDGGALGNLPGDCKIGMRFGPGPKAKPEQIEELAKDKNLASSSPALKAVGAKVEEILIGY